MKKIIATICTVLAAILITCQPVCAASQPCIEGDGHYELDNGVLTITGTGKITLIGNPGHDPRPFFHISCDKVVIGEGITEIGGNSFDYFEYIGELELPNSLEKIGGAAFVGTDGLRTVTIPANVVEIGPSAFWNCGDLESIVIPDSLTRLGWGVFSECASLKSVTLPSNITKLENQVFIGCTSIEEVNVPEKVTSIGCGTFKDCAALKKVIIPKTVESIDEGAFTNSDNVVLYVYNNSYALSYAKHQGLKYVIVDLPEDQPSDGKNEDKSDEEDFEVIPVKTKPEDDYGRATKSTLPYETIQAYDLEKGTVASTDIKALNSQYHDCVNHSIFASYCAKQLGYKSSEIIITKDIFPTYGKEKTWKESKRVLTWKNADIKAGDNIYVVWYCQEKKQMEFIKADAVYDGGVRFTLPMIGNTSIVSLVRVK